MKKVSIISPVFDKIYKIPETMNSLLSFFKGKYDFEVYYYYNGELSKEVMQDYHFNFVKIGKNNNFNDCVADAFNRVNGDCIIVADLNDIDYQDYIHKLLVEWEAKSQIVLVKKQKSETFWGKIGNFFAGIGRKVYDFMLSFAGLNSDFHAYKNFQLFAKEVVEVIKSFPDRNYYLRNFDCWVDFRVSVLYANKKVKVKNKQKVFNRELIFALSSFGLMLATILLLVFGRAQVAQSSIVVFTLIGIGLSACLGIFAFYNLFWWFICRKTCLERNHNK